MSDDTATISDAEFAAAVASMLEAGKRAGTASGSWIADGNTSEEHLRAVLQQWEDGDPAAPSAPAPFSGGWAGDPSIEDVIGSETDLEVESLTPEEISELADSFEEGFYSAWQEEAERTVRGLLPDDEPSEIREGPWNTREEAEAFAAAEVHAPCRIEYGGSGWFVVVSAEN